MSVHYTVSGTATNGTDYNTLDGTRMIAAGSSSVTIIVTPKNDSAVEGDESVVLTISSNTAYQIGSPASATVNIADNAAPPTTPTVTISATDSIASENESNKGEFTITRTGSTSSSLSISYTVGGTASNGIDFPLLGGSVIIPAGSSSVSIGIYPVGDEIKEPSEKVVLTIQSGSGYQVGSSNSATVTIVGFN